MVYGQCRSCKAQIVWSKAAATGARMPLDPEPNDEIGNILVDGHGRAHAFRNRAAAIAFRDAHPDGDLGGSGTHVSHFVTCPTRGEPRPATRSESAQGSLL
jgi:hypothetical protein